MSAVEMMTEENVARVREYVDKVWSQGDLRAGDAYIADTFVNPDNDILGPAGARQWAQRWRTAFPNQHKTFDLLFGVDNLVVAVFNEQGSHLGELFGLAPTGVNATWQVIAIFDSRDQYYANANDPQQDRWRRKFHELLEDDPQWTDGDVVFGWSQSQLLM